MAVACDSLGLGHAMLDATVEYAKVRRQFDQPIGSFQSVKHQCADALVQLTIGRELLQLAVDAVAAGAPDAGLAAARAKAYLGQAAVAPPVLRADALGHLDKARQLGLQVGMVGVLDVVRQRGEPLQQPATQRGICGIDNGFQGCRLQVRYLARRPTAADPVPDPRVVQFIEGEAQPRLSELAGPGRGEGGWQP